MNLSEKILRLRTARGMSQGDLAEQLGCPASLFQSGRRGNRFLIWIRSSNWQICLG